ncbi:TetR/AcrR family transcriptional regulator [Amycolatopsis acidicola]|uniref:TetR/AcrR family transcriptional regulator n=1 Tax=Amycolatopsis acidicola TaxID=2596893 RepID=A0A5N0VFM1_9PSEU|nr:TetR/AcrR family transcriptional regulator [Amycolatopsis acidicola]KAA9164398.1 TetR/AcrR family transcriptional regulator [Amycolatopsis acidicola]
MPGGRNGPETRQQIIDRFSELVADHGFEEASVSMLASSLGISKGTVVHHFPSKNLILCEAHLQYMDRRVREMYRILEHVQVPEHQLAAMMYCIIRAHRDDRPGTISFLREQSRFPFGGDVANLRTLRNEFTSIMTGILRRGQLSGAFAFEQVTLTAMQIFGQCNYVWTWFRLDEAATVEEVSAEFAANILRGVRATGKADDPEFSPKKLREFFVSLTPHLAPHHPPAGSRRTA